MGYVMAAEQAVPVAPSPAEMVFGIASVLITLVVVAGAVGLLVGGLVLAGRVRRQGERLAQVEARLVAAEGDQAQ